MPRYSTLHTLLSNVPSRTRDELLYFLEFSERNAAKNPKSATEELLVSLSFLNASALRPN